MKKKYLLVISSILMLQLISFSQNIKKDKERSVIKKSASIKDRAAGIHDASNIGLFFENRGKLYPRTLAQGPSGEFPINSTKNYIYRSNQFVGIRGNVIQGRFTTNEEWEAVSGYHNSDTARVAFSDDPNSWHKTLGWPVKDANGNNIFVSDQDSYCVFNDSNNTVKVLGIQMTQTGYAFGTNFAKNMLFFKYELTNKSNTNYSGVYFGLHTDVDVGDFSGGLPEWGDDKVGFIKAKNLVYYHDDGLSGEWPGGKTGFFGNAMLKTPKVNGKQLGVTDMHYFLYDDDNISDKDSIQYGFMSSDTNLFLSSVSKKYFHVGNSTNIHYDDIATVPASGMDILANISSGPYNLNPGDTLVFYTAFVAGNTLEELITATETAQTAVDLNFNLPKAPVRPKLYSSAGNMKATIFWDDKSELSLDAFSGYDFEGYRLYRSRDKGKNWDLIQEYDLKNSFGKNSGLKYNFIDTTVINGFDYWYSITAFDRGSDVVESLESPLGNTLEAVNTVSVIPRSDAIGRNPVSITDVVNLKTGNTNYILDVTVIDNEQLSNNKYKTNFTFNSYKEVGDLATKVIIEISDSSITKPYQYELKFLSPTLFDLKNRTLGTTVRAGYSYPLGGRFVLISNDGLRITLQDTTNTLSQFRPEQGDIITINFALNVIRNSKDTLIKNRSHQLSQTQSTNDGVALKFSELKIIKNVSRIGGTENVQLEFKVLYPDSIKEKIYIISFEGNGSLNGKGFVILSVSETNVKLDTLLTSETFYFDGIQGKIIFPSTTSPSTANRFSLETTKPIIPNIKDSYSFSVKGAEIDQLKVTSELNKIRVVPNPYIGSSLFEPEFGELRKEPLRQIQFINLPSECTIYIFTVDADLIKTIYHNTPIGTEVWDLRTESGRELAAGIYIYVVKTKNGDFKERFALIK